MNVVKIDDASVSFDISSINCWSVKHRITNAFTSGSLNLTEHTYPIEWLKRQHFHLKDLPLPLINKAQPLVLIGSDHAELLVPITPVRMGTAGSPLPPQQHSIVNLPKGSYVIAAWHQTLSEKGTQTGKDI